MGEGLTYWGDTAPPPRGFAVRYFGPPERELPGSELWHLAMVLPDGGVGLALGRCPDRRGDRVGAAVAAALRAGSDPETALSTAGGDGAAVCAVISPSQTRVDYSWLSGVQQYPPTVMLEPPEPSAPSPGAAVSANLARGATLLLYSGNERDVAGLLAGCAADPPQHCLQILGDALSPARGAGDVAVLYRCPPGPLDLRMPADPRNLAVVRERMRRWLGVAGVDDGTAADALLAVGEAASNASEHAMLGVSHPVELAVHAAVDGHRLRFRVSDNGRWKPAAADVGVCDHRGHGLKLINALVDTAEVTTDERGTTVEMLKELRP